MKARTKTHSTLKKSLAAIIIIALAVGGYAFAAHHFQLWPFPPKTSTNQAQQEKQTGTDIKNQTQGNQNNSNASGSTPVSNPTPGQSGGKSTVPVTITAANQSGSTLQIRALISAIVNGTCTLTLTGPGTTYTATANVQSLPSSSTCEGFNVPTSKLAPGAWNVTINFENDSLQGSASQSITVQ